MLKVEYSENLLKIISKIKDESIKKKVKKQIKKVIDQPATGKPMKYARKGTREIYMGSYRLAYAYIKDKNKLIFLDLYHKDEQ